MRVLVFESDPGAAERAIGAVREAGHEVVTCFERGLGSFPCRALFSDEECPLDIRPVDVALVVRAHPWPSPTPYEHGVTCALRAGVPLVLAGRLALNPFERWAAAEVDDNLPLVEACAAACNGSKT